MKKLFLTGLVFCLAPLGFALPVQSLLLPPCEQAALSFSPKLKQLEAEALAAQSVYNSSRSSRYPSLYLDAKGSWVSEVPSLQLGSQKMEFGDNWGYSVGPTLNYTLFDNGARGDASDSAQAAYQARLSNLSFGRKQVVLQVRQAYFSVQQNLESIYLLSEQLKVARKQLRDVESAFSAGAKSKLDMLMAQKQVLRASVDVSNARGALGENLRDLFKLTGSDFGINPAYALDVRVQEKLEGQTSAVIAAEDPADTFAHMSALSNLSFDGQSPQLVALDQLTQYYEYSARSFAAALWPQVNATAGAYWEYPNGPVREDVFLGRAGVSLRMPLFEGGRNQEQARAQRQTASATQYQKADVEEGLKSLFFAAKDQLYSLGVQSALTQSLNVTAAESARLTYQAYQAGAVTFLEVDDANLAWLQSRIGLANLYIGQLNALALMDSLGK